MAGAWTSGPRQSARDSRGRTGVEGQNLRTPITSWLCTLAMACALLLASAQAQAPPTPSDTSAPQDQSQKNPDSFSKYAGQTVSTIQFRGFTGSDPAMLQSLVAQKTGEPLDRDKLRASISALYATGRFSTLNAEVEPGPQNTVTLAFVVTENY